MDSKNIPYTEAEIRKKISKAELNLACSERKQQIPSFIMQMTELKKLTIHNSQFTGRIPDDIGNLTNLNQLTLSKNYLTGPIPQSISNLTKLSSIGLVSTNAKGEVEDDNNFTGDISSGFLAILASCKPRIIPPGLKISGDFNASHFQHLTDLNLFNLRLTGNLPSAISQLTHLKSLNLCGNNFTDGSYRTLAYLPFEKINDMCVDMPYHIRFHTTENNNNIKWHLQRVLDEDRIDIPTKPGKRAKVLFLGPGMAGKSTLINLLSSGNFDASSPFTDGVEMKYMVCDDHVFYMWDLSGQDVYFATHTMFFSEDAIYVIVINVRENVDISPYYESIKKYAPHNRIAIVTTRASERVDTTPVDAFVSSLEHKPKQLAVDSKDGTGIGDLKKWLQSTSDQLPSTYTSEQTFQEAMILFNRLQTYKDRFALSRREIHSIGNTATLRSDDDIDKMLICYEKWGLILFLANDMICLTPKTLAGVLAKVVTKSKTYVVARGVLRHSDIATIWESFNSTLQLALLDLLHKNRIAFPIISERNDKSIVPAMLEEFPKDLSSVVPNDVINKCIKLTLTTGKSLPLAFIPTLMSRVHSYILTDKIWRNGFVMMDRSRTSMAMVCEQDNRTSLVIYFNGTLMCQSILAYTIDTLLSTRYDKVKFQACLTFGRNTYNDEAIKTQLKKSSEMPGVDDSGGPIAIPLQYVAVILGILVPVTSISTVDDKEDQSILPAEFQRLHRSCSYFKQHHTDESDRVSVVAELLKCIPKINELQNLRHIKVLTLAFEDTATNSLCIGMITPDVQLTSAFIYTSMMNVLNASKVPEVHSELTMLIEDALDIIGVRGVANLTFIGLRDLSALNKDILDMQHESFREVDSDIGMRIYKHTAQAIDGFKHLENVVVNQFLIMEERMKVRHVEIIDMKKEMEKLNNGTISLSKRVSNINRKMATLTELKTLATEFENHLVFQMKTRLHEMHNNLQNNINESTRDIIKEVRDATLEVNVNVQEMQDRLIQVITTTNETTINVLNEIQSKVETLQHTSKKIDSTVTQIFQSSEWLKKSFFDFDAISKIIEGRIQSLSENIITLSDKSDVFHTAIVAMQSNLDEQKALLNKVSLAQESIQASQESVDNVMYDLDEALDNLDAMKSQFIHRLDQLDTTQRELLLGQSNQSKALDEALSSLKNMSPLDKLDTTQRDLLQCQPNPSNTTKDIYDMILAGQLVNVQQIPDLQPMMDEIKQLQSMVRTLISNMHGVPTLCLLVPEKHKGLQLVNPGNLWRKSYRLFFVCAHTFRIACCGPDGKGYHVHVTREWLKQAAPVLSMTMAVIKLVISLYGIPLPIPDCTGNMDLGVNDYSAHAEQFEEELSKDLEDKAELMKRIVGSDATKYLKNLDLDMETSRIAYEAIRSMLHDNDPTLKHTGLVQSTARGITKWIWNLPEVCQSFEQSDDATDDALIAVLNKSLEIYAHAAEAAKSSTVLNRLRSAFSWTKKKP